MDFTDLDTKIRLNEKRLKDERERLNTTRSKIGVMFIIFSIYTACTIQLFNLIVKNENYDMMITIPATIFVIFTIVSIIFSIAMYMPVDKETAKLPKYFYNDEFDYQLGDDKNKDNSINEINREVNIMYLNSIKKSLDSQYKINNTKGKLHFWSFRCALLALLPYLFCIGVIILNSPSKIQKVELTNTYFKTKEELIMSSEDDKKKKEKEDFIKQREKDKEITRVVTDIINEAESKPKPAKPDTTPITKDKKK